MTAALIGPAPVPVDVLACPDATVAAWAGWLGRTGLADDTKRAYIGEARSYAVWLAGQELHRPYEVFCDPYARDYAVRDYRRYLLTERKRAPKGVDLALTAVGSVYRWVGLGPANVRQAAGRQKSAPRALAVEQTRAVFRAAERRGPRDLALTAVAMGTGLRVSELAALDLDDVWVTARQGEVQVRAGKGDRPRKVPLNGQTRTAVDGWLADRRRWPQAGTGRALFLSRIGGRLAVRSIRHTIGEVGRAAGVDLSPHVLRHTFGTSLVRSGVDVVVVADLMGHASLDTTRLYARPSADDARAAVERLHLDY